MSIINFHRYGILATIVAVFGAVFVSAYLAYLSNEVKDGSLLVVALVVILFLGFVFTFWLRLGGSTRLGSNSLIYLALLLLTAGVGHFPVGTLN